MKSEEKSVPEKLREYRLKMQYSQALMGKLTGVSQQVYSNIESGETKKYSHEFGVKATNLFVNTPDEDQKKIIAETVIPNGERVKAPGSKARGKKSGDGLIPYYEIDFMAGNSLEFYEDTTVKPAYFMDVPEFRGCTAFRAYSDSMEKLIISGNILFGTKIEDWRSHLEYGQIYGIIMSDRRRYLKYIRRSNKPSETFLLKSQNENYDDFDVPKSKIKSIWLIDGWLNRRT